MNINVYILRFILLSSDLIQNIQNGVVWLQKNQQPCAQFISEINLVPFIFFYGETWKQALVNVAEWRVHKPVMSGVSLLSVIM